MGIKEQIAALEKEIICGLKDVVSLEHLARLNVDDLKALAASHDRLLAAAKDFRDLIDGHSKGGHATACYLRDCFDEAIEAAELI